MRRRSLRLPSPDSFPNSDGNTGAFFRAENYRREFYVPKTSELSSWKDLSSEAELMMPFYRRMENKSSYALEMRQKSAEIIIF